ncbi:hypothetical protein RB595_000834 [Gaeumannomyces hyphopodioides]
MRTRCAAPRCRLPTPSHITPADSLTGGIWITDSMLSGVFERYCSVTKASRRMASSAPGPLESSRRLGRRRIADAAMSQTHPALPSWAYMYPADLTQWRWERPTPASSRAQTQPNDESAHNVPPLPASWLSALLGWDGGASPRTYAHSEEDRETVAVTPPEAVSEGQGTTALDKAESVQKQCLLFWDEIQALDAARSPELLIVAKARYTEIMESFQQYISLGILTPGECELALETLSEKIRRKFCKPSLHNRLLLQLYIKTVRGARSSRLAHAEKYNRLPIQLLKGLSELNSGAHLIRGFREVMAEVTPELLGNKELGWVQTILRSCLSTWSVGPSWRNRSHLSTVFDIAQGELGVFSGRLSALQAALSSDTGIEYCLRAADAASGSLQICDRALRLSREMRISGLDIERIHISLLANAMRGFHLGQYPDVMRAAEKAVAEQRGQPHHHRVLINWLSVLSQMPQVRQKTLFAVMSGSYESSRAEQVRSSSVFSEVELCHLLIEQWMSRGHLTYKEYRVLRSRLRGSGPGHGLPSLVESVYDVKKADSALWFYLGLWRCLQAISATGRLVLALERLSRQHRARLRPALAKLAQAVTSRRVADGIHGLYHGLDEYHFAVEASASRGESDRALREMVNDADYHPFEVFEALGQPLITKNTHPAARKRILHRRCHISRRQAAISAKLSVMFSKAAHLTDRQRFRYVSHCVLLLKRYKTHGREASAAMTGLFKVVTKDLLESGWTRPSRIQWFLRLVKESQGAAAAAKCRKALDTWTQVWARRRREERAQREDESGNYIR